MKYIISVFLLFAFIQGHAQNKAQQMRELLYEYHNYEQFSGTVLVAKGGQIIYQEAIGMADREWKIQHTLDGKFIVGSLSKQFTAALTMVFHQEGKIDLNASVQDYLPNYPNPEIGKKVTVHHLLSCSSGLPHYQAWGDFLEQNDRLFYSREELLEKFKDVSLDNEPGERYRYSSLGYLLLGLILEAVGEDDLGVLFKEKLFDPAGMYNSSLDDQITILPNRVKAYRYNFKKARYDNANYRDPSTSNTAGGILTTASDLLTWDRVLAGNDLLTEDSKKKLFTANMGNYAYGWRTTFPGWDTPKTVQWHAGQLTGYKSIMLRIVEDDYVIILLSNIRDMPHTEITSGIINILYGDPVQHPQRSLLKTLLAEIVEKGTDQAIELYHRLKKESLEEYSFGVTELIVLGIELNSEGLLQEAIPILELSLKEYPESPYLLNHWMLLGGIHTRLGDMDDAKKSYEKALEINPDYERAKQALAELNNE